jgi:hypothetical protein
VLAAAARDHAPPPAAPLPPAPASADGVPSRGRE